jgi:hypothetical protein
MIAFCTDWWDNQAMKERDAKRHPGPFHIMGVDAEFAGILVAGAFLVLGLVALPLAKWFFLGALIFGAGMALLLRLTRKG